MMAPDQNSCNSNCEDNQDISSRPFIVVQLGTDVQQGVAREQPLSRQQQDHPNHCNASRLQQQEAQHLSHHFSHLRKLTWPTRLLRFLSIIAPLLVFGIAIGSAVALYLSISSVQWSHLTSSAEVFCLTQCDRFQTKLASRFLQPLHAVNAFLAQMPVVSQGIVTRFCDQSHWSRRVRLSITQQVKNEDRLAWEARNNVTIKWIQPLYSDNGTFISIGTPKLKPYDSEPLYYPSVIVYPADTNALHGIDSNHATRRLAFRRAAAACITPLFANNTTCLSGYLSDPFRMVAGNGATSDMPHPFGIAYILPPTLPRANGDVHLVTGGYNLHDFIRSAIALPETEKTGMRIILTINGTRVYETVAFDDMGQDTQITVTEQFTMAGQTFKMTCIPTESRQAFYVNQWRFVTPSLLLAVGMLVSAVLGRLLRQYMSIHETSVDIKKMKLCSQSILQASANPMLVTDRNGKVSGLNAPFLALTGQSSRSLRGAISVTNLLKQPNASDIDANSSYFLQPGKREVHIHRATGPNGAQPPINAILSVSDPIRAHPSIHKVLVLTEVSDRKARDAVVEQRLQLLTVLNAQQRQVLTYVVDQLGNLIAASKSATNEQLITSSNAEYAVQLAIRHLIDVQEELSHVSVEDCAETDTYTVDGKMLHGELSSIVSVVPVSPVYEVPYALSLASLSALVKFARITASLGVKDIQVAFRRPSDLMSVNEQHHLVVSAQLPESTPYATKAIIAEDRDWMPLGDEDLSWLAVRMLALRNRLLQQCGGSLEVSGLLMYVTVPAKVQSFN